MGSIPSKCYFVCSHKKVRDEIEDVIEEVKDVIEVVSDVLDDYDDKK